MTARTDISPTRVPGLVLVGVVLAAGIAYAAWQRLARPLHHTPVSAREASTFWPDARLDINRARAVELEVLPAIGPGLAERIVRDRAENGPFESIEALARVDGVGARTIERIRPYVVTSREERRDAP